MSRWARLRLPFLELFLFFPLLWRGVLEERLPLGGLLDAELLGSESLELVLSEELLLLSELLEAPLAVEFLLRRLRGCRTLALLLLLLPLLLLLLLLPLLLLLLLSLLSLLLAVSRP